METTTIDLGREPVGKLFRTYFIPTLLGMLSLSVVTMADGIFVGQGVGPAGVAAVNIIWAPMMSVIGFGLRLGIGCSVIASIRLAHGETDKARLGVSHALAGASLVVGLIVLLLMARPRTTARLLGSSESLLDMATDYLVWFAPALVLNMWSIIGLFVVRLDGSPRFAMWCNVVPGLLNIFLDWLFVFPLGMGLKGAAIATAIAVSVGAFMAVGYLGFFARTLRLIRFSLSAHGIAAMARTMLYQMRIGVSAFLGEATMAMVMFTGNLVFMHYMGDDGVAAFGIACYYCPFFFLIGNAIAQSAQPIISYNYGLGLWERVKGTETLAIKTALGFGIVVTAAFIAFPRPMVELFIDIDSRAALYAVKGLPIFASCVVCFIFNVTAIGYFQSVERVAPSVWFALLRGLIFLVPSFILMPMAFGDTGIWLAVAASELLTTLGIIGYYLVHHRK